MTYKLYEHISFFFWLLVLQFHTNMYTYTYFQNGPLAVPYLIHHTPSYAKKNTANINCNAFERQCNWLSAGIGQKDSGKGKTQRTKKKEHCLCVFDDLCMRLNGMLRFWSIFLFFRIVLCLWNKKKTNLRQSHLYYLVFWSNNIFISRFHFLHRSLTQTSHKHQNSKKICDFSQICLCTYVSLKTQTKKKTYENKKERATQPTHTHTHRHRHRHKYIHTQLKCTHTNAHIQMHTHKRTHTQTNTYITITNLH